MSLYSTNQRLIDIRRKNEEKYRQMDTLIAADRKILQIATFEQTTSNKINSRLKKVSSYGWLDYLYVDETNITVLMWLGAIWTIKEGTRRLTESKTKETGWFI